MKRKKYYRFPDELEKMTKDLEKDMERKGIKRNPKWIRKG